MHKRTARLTTPILLLALLPCLTGGGVATGQDRQDEPPINLGADLVLLDVSVVDRAGHPVRTLPKTRFSVLEDGVQQDIEFFNSAQAAASIAFVLDTSGSMRTKLKQTTEAASRILDGAQPDDEFAVVEFRDSANLIEEFTSNTNDVRDALGGLQATGQTTLIDAAYLAADYVQHDGRNRLKAVVLVSDGLDKGSYYTVEQLVDHVRALDVRLYVIGFTIDLEGGGGVFRKSEKEKADQLLAKLAKETGGQAFFPSRLEDLTSINDAIATDLRTVYSIGYYSTNQKKDGTFRTVAVKVLGTNGREDATMTVRTRSGYMAEKS